MAPSVDEYMMFPMLNDATKYIEQQIGAEVVGICMEFLVKCALYILTHVLALMFVGMWVDWGLAALITVLRLGVGINAAEGIEECHRPAVPLILFEYEGNSKCRSVRETLSVLGLDVVVYPVPCRTADEYRQNTVTTVAGSRFGPEAVRLFRENKAGKIQFPMLIDPNMPDQPIFTDCFNIIDYLWASYGNKAKKSYAYKVVSALDRSEWLVCKIYRELPQYIRPLEFMGWMKVYSVSLPHEIQQQHNDSGPIPVGFQTVPKPITPVHLHLYGFENCPQTRIVKECLTVMEYPYVMHYVPRRYHSKCSEVSEMYGAHWSRPWRWIHLLKYPLLVNTTIEPVGKGNINEEGRVVVGSIFRPHYIMDYLLRTFVYGPIAGTVWHTIQHISVIIRVLEALLTIHYTDESGSTTSNAFNLFKHLDAQRGRFTPAPMPVRPGGSKLKTEVKTHDGALYAPRYAAVSTTETPANPRTTPSSHSREDSTSCGTDVMRELMISRELDELLSAVVINKLNRSGELSEEDVGDVEDY